MGTLQCTDTTLKYCKQTFIRGREIVRATSWQILYTANQSLMYGCYNNKGLDKAWSQKLVFAKRSIPRRLLNKVNTNKSWFTVSCFLSSCNNC